MSSPHHYGDVVPSICIPPSPPPLPLVHLCPRTRLKDTTCLFSNTQQQCVLKRACVLKYINGIVSSFVKLVCISPLLPPPAPPLLSHRLLLCWGGTFGDRRQRKRTTTTWRRETATTAATATAVRGGRQSRERRPKEAPLAAGRRPPPGRYVGRFFFCRAPAPFRQCCVIVPLGACFYLILRLDFWLGITAEVLINLPIKGLSSRC